jgi:hypothetical protein
MGIESIVISACITVFALGLFIVSLASYKKHKNQKLLFICLVFFIFLIKGILLSLGMFSPQLATLASNPYVGLFDLVILATLFIATLKR